MIAAMALTAGWAVGLVAAGAIVGWIAHVFEIGARRERAVEQLRRFGPAPSNCRVVPRPYDWERQGG